MSSQFSLFPLLPQEIQDLIWIQAAKREPMAQFATLELQTTPPNLLSPIDDNVNYYRAPPDNQEDALLRACRRSRSIAKTERKEWTIAEPFDLDKGMTLPALKIDGKHDLVLLTPGWSLALQQHLPVMLNVHPKLHLRFLGVPWSPRIGDWAEVGPWPQCKSIKVLVAVAFQQLRVFYILISPEDLQQVYGTMPPRRTEGDANSFRCGNREFYEVSEPLGLERPLGLREPFRIVDCMRNSRPLDTRIPTAMSMLDARLLTWRAIN
ncbi:hypothetical protein BKA56DRAFT_607657 [Ilyonectria sp. MPI-CAGE-AT-0026]|nr:hypothetical protein BKA56DRAFT_607657 [Ilyonectria sp. MPI-CAGE-AT-0026]